MKKILLIVAIIVIAAGSIGGWLAYHYRQDQTRKAQAAKQAKASAEALLSMTPKQISQLDPSTQKKVKQAQSEEKTLKSLKFKTLADYETLAKIDSRPL